MTKWALLRPAPGSISVIALAVHALFLGPVSANPGAPPFPAAAAGAIVQDGNSGHAEVSSDSASLAVSGTRLAHETPAAAGTQEASGTPDAPETLACPSCDDGNACTTDYCDLATSLCVHIPVECYDNSPCTTDGCVPELGCQFALHPDGEICNDFDPCTTGDHCESGLCREAAAVDCNDGNYCSYDFCNGLGQCSHFYFQCDDGNACTFDDCDPATGLCNNIQAPVGYACDDGNACTTSDRCVPGPGNAVVCIGTITTGTPCDDGDLCTHDDQCVPVLSPSEVGCRGTAIDCDDGQPCSSDYCNSGQCGHAAASCDDNNPCTADSCDQNGCQHQPLAGSPCQDSEPCTIDDACIFVTGGIACRGTPNLGAPCVDTNACTVNDRCVAGGPRGAVCAGTLLDCEDGNPCTTSECTGAPAHCLVERHVCDDFNPCTNDLCDPSRGCVRSDRTDGTACSDSTPCTTGDHCMGGSCLGTPLDCNDANPCTNDFCLYNCVHTARSCPDYEACTIDGCDPMTGQCTESSYSDGVPCWDANPCTRNDTCSMGVCQGAYAPDSTPCDDGDSCTTADHCSSGSCAGTPVVCDDHLDCSFDSCVPNTTQCVFEPQAVGEVSQVAFTDRVTLQWTPANGVGPSHWNTYRGSIPAAGLGSRLPGPVYDHACFESGDALGDGALITTDPGTPPVGTAWYYDVTQENPCIEGPLGSASSGAPRPNASPCPTPP